MSVFENFWVAGVNYKKTALHIRNKFALTSQAVKGIYSDNSGNGSPNYFILSTCNRTEIYSSSGDQQLYIDLFLRYSEATEEEIREYSFFKSGHEAIAHLFRVAAGLESQIIGDYEIIGQLKNAFAIAREYGLVDGCLHKIVNTALQSSRAVRNSTSVSDGTTSVSYAVIQLIKKLYENEKPQKICLMGLGKIGSLTLKNLKQHLAHHDIVLVNRNQSKAEALAEKHEVSYRPMGQQVGALADSDILIVATGADHPIVSRNMVENSSVKTIFDLSVPSNVTPEVREISNLKYFDIDSLSSIVNENLQRREREVPLALQIIDDHIQELDSWQARKLQYTNS